MTEQQEQKTEPMTVGFVRLSKNRRTLKLQLSETNMKRAETFTSKGKFLNGHTMVKVFASVESIRDLVNDPQCDFASVYCFVPVNEEKF